MSYYLTNNDLNNIDINFSPFFNNLFDDCCSLTTIAVTIDILEKDDAYTINVDLPGFKQKDLNIKVEKGLLKMKAKKKERIKDKKESFILQERKELELNKSFRIPNDVDTKGIDFHFERGVLKIYLPKQVEIKKNKKTLNCLRP